MPNRYKLLKYSCYTTNVTMSVTTNLSPVLFLTFRSEYGISYSLLGLPSLAGSLGRRKINVKKVL